MNAPYQPQKKDDNFDEKQANGVDKWKEENAELLKDNANLLRRDSIQNLFAGYYFDLNKDSKIDIKEIEKHLLAL